MGLMDFVKNVGKKLKIGDQDDDKTPQAPAPAAGPSAQQVQELNDRKKAAALVKLVTDMGFKVEELGIRVDDDKATLSGRVNSQEEREKIVLLVGNVDGIGRVDDNFEVEKQEPESTYYEVKSGDSLSKIAKQVYGDANKYNRIFEANRPMLKDADEIYPGQKLRIPPLA
jgi:nucleoid-associated protein YgaU